MINGKPWYKSRTIWTQVIALGVLLASRAGIDGGAVDTDLVVLVDALITIALRFKSNTAIV